MLKKIISFFVVLLISCVFLFGCGAPRDNTASAPAPPGNTAPAPSSELEYTVEEAVKELPIGSILFNPPEEMVAGQKERVEVRIAKSVSDNFDEGLKGHGTPQIEKIMVGQIMDVQLEGENFDIKKLSDNNQRVFSQGFTQWAWDVKPLESGDQTLTLIVKVKINIPNAPEEHVNIPVVDKEIHVKVNPVYTMKSFAGENWPLFFTALIAPLLFWWLTGGRKK